MLLLIISCKTIAQDTNQTTIDTTTVTSEKFEMQKSPWGAVLRSAIIPGWGQIYNESYWKVPIIWGLTGWFVYAWIDNNKQYKDYRDLYSETGNSRYQRLRDFYLDQRDEFAIYIAITYLLNLVDAYVDAHLFDFSIDENISTGQKMYNIRVHF